MVQASRRTLVAGAEWAVPAVVVASPAPAFAISNCTIERQGFVSLDSTFRQTGLPGLADMWLHSVGDDSLAFFDSTAAPTDLIRPSVDIFLDSASADLEGRWRKDTSLTSPGWSELTLVNRSVTRPEIPGVQLSQWQLIHEPVTPGTPLPFRFDVSLEDTFPSYPYLVDLGVMQLSLGRQYHVRGVTYPGCSWDSEVAGGPTEPPNIGVVGSNVALRASRQGSTITFSELSMPFRTYRDGLRFSRPRVILYLDGYASSLPTSAGWTDLTYVSRTGNFFRYESYRTTPDASWTSVAGDTRTFGDLSAQISSSSQIRWAVQSGITIEGHAFDVSKVSTVGAI